MSKRVEYNHGDHSSWVWVWARDNQESVRLAPKGAKHAIGSYKGAQEHAIIGTIDHLRQDIRAGLVDNQESFLAIGARSGGSHARHAVLVYQDSVDVFGASEYIGSLGQIPGDEAHKVEAWTYRNDANFPNGQFFGIVPAPKPDIEIQKLQRALALSELLDMPWKDIAPGTAERLEHKAARAAKAYGAYLDARPLQPAAYA